jgi:L-fucose isomerase-like protein
MIPLRMLAFDNAPKQVFETGEGLLKKYFEDFDFDMSAKKPFVLFFLSGGSERSAIETTAGSDFCLLLAYEQNNSFAAAAEVKARLHRDGTDCLLLDINEMPDRDQAGTYMKAFMALNILKGKRLGLIGNPSDWLVASGIDHDLLRSRLGIRLVNIAWDSVPDVRNQAANKAFLHKFSSSGEHDTTSAARVHQALQEVVRKFNLDAFTIECFPMVQKDGVTACLSLSEFNDRGIPAGCEGDMASIVGMMFLEAVTGTIPWMANLIKIGQDSIKLAHCTAPTRLLKSFSVDSHFETGKGTAVSGLFANGVVTIFRLGSSLDRAFMTTGNILSAMNSPAAACRTMIEVKIPTEKASSLRSCPLENHHLVLPGDFRDLIILACALKKIHLIPG